MKWCCLLLSVNSSCFLLSLSSFLPLFHSLPLPPSTHTYSTIVQRVIDRLHQRRWRHLWRTMVSSDTLRPLSKMAPISMKHWSKQQSHVTCDSHVIVVWQLSESCDSHVTVVPVMWQLCDSCLSHVTVMWQLSQSCDSCVIVFRFGFSCWFTGSPFYSLDNGTWVNIHFQRATGRVCNTCSVYIASYSNVLNVDKY